MSEGPPRVSVDELLSRWRFAKLRLVVVEGPSDQRLIRLVQEEAHCNAWLSALDVWAVDAIDVPAACIQKHGLKGTGAKQRVIAFAREIESLEDGDGFRGLVDKDLDEFFRVELRSHTVLYTDYGCMDAYLWTTEVLRRLIIQFRCEGNIKTTNEIEELFSSVVASCADIAAVRIASEQHPEWCIQLHHSDKALNLHQKKINVDLPKYLAQCKPAGGSLNAAKDLVADVRLKIDVLGPINVLNGHDLLWMLTFALRELTTATRRTVDEETIARSLVAFGILNEKLTTAPMFQSLITWITPTTG